MDAGTMKSEGGEIKREKGRIIGVFVCRVDENKETGTDGRTHGRTDGRTDGRTPSAAADALLRQACTTPRLLECFPNILPLSLVLLVRRIDAPYIVSIAPSQAFTKRSDH